MGEVYRARDRRGLEAALKRVAPLEHGPTLSTVEGAAAPAGAVTQQATTVREPVAEGIVPPAPLARSVAATLGLALAREFRALRALRHPNVVEVRDFGFDAALGPFFTMQLLDGAVPIDVAAAGAPFERKVELIGQLLRAVRYIHGHGVLHRDLSARNVLVERGTVKVLDFGLAVLSEDRDPRLARWGTRGYFAPEVAQGVPASRRSDLYAVGVLALETLVEVRLHEAEEIAGALENVDPRVRPLLTALTAQDWRARPEDAGKVLAALAAATGVVVPLDTAATLESALTTARLVGRDRELSVLDAAIEELTRHGRGWTLRLEGESGIGKSRLMDEMGTRAHVAGCLVLEGQAREEGGGPFEVLVGVVRGLALELDLSDEETRALAPVVAVGAGPVEAEVEDASRRIDPEILRDELFSVLERLLRRSAVVTTRDGDPSPRPVVLLFEDVHWATDVALSVIARIAALTATLPLLLVASHRDGVSPGVSKELAAFRPMRIERLADDDARRLVLATMGEAPRELTERLARESEGHPLFLVELLRWSAEHGVADAASRERQLPDRIASIVRARLGELSPAARALSCAAAVVGREVDAALVGAVAERTADDVEGWLREALGAWLLEVHGERCRFAHDKLREGVLATIPVSELRTLHLRAGLELERRARDPLVESAALAHHFQSAGDAERTAKWAAIAGERALASGANAEAIRLLELALHALGPGGAPAHRARLTRLVGAAHARIGDYEAAHERGMSALRVLSREPDGTARRALQMLSDAATLATKGESPGAPTPSAELEEALLAYYHVSETAFLRDAPGDLFWGVLRALVLADAGPKAAQISVYGAAGLLAGTLRLERAARRWSTRAIALAEDLGAPGLLASAVHRRAVCAVIRAEWELAERLLTRARETALAGLDRRQWQESTTVLGLTAAHRGDLAGAARLHREVHESGKQHGDRQGVLWGGPLGALCHLHLGELGGADVLLEEASSRIDHATSVYDLINFHGARSLARFGAGEREAAVREAERVLDLLGSMRLSAYWTFHGLEGALTTLFSALDATDDSLVRRRLLRLVARGCSEARRLARFCVFAGPSALVWEGRRRAALGDRRRARGDWTKARAAARALGLELVAASAGRLREA